MPNSESLFATQNLQKQFSESSALDSENQNLNSQNQVSSQNPNSQPQIPNSENPTTQAQNPTPHQEYLIPHHHAQNLLRTLPLILRIMHHCGLLKIYFVRDNFKSSNKLIHALKIYPHDAIVTIDDDQVYDRTMLSLLLRSSVAHPHCIHAHWLERPTLYERNELKKRLYWDSQESQYQDRPVLYGIPLGVGGVLYAPHSLDSKIFDRSAFLRLCPHNDDLWFFVCGVLQGSQKVLVNGALGHPTPSVATFETPTLFDKNRCVERGGDGFFQIEFENLMREFPDVKRKIIESLIADSEGL